MALSQGDALPAVTVEMTQEKILAYARASGDFNPIHIDREFAARSQFGRTIAHGMLVLAYLSQMMTTAFGERWLEGGRLKVRFRAPVYPGDTVTTFGQVKGTATYKDTPYLECVVGCRNHRGEEVITGEARVPHRHYEKGEP